MNGTGMNNSFTNGSFQVQNISTDPFWIDDPVVTSNTSVPNTDEPDEKLRLLKNVMFTIQYVILPLFLITGFFGNMFTIITMASRRFRHLTSRYILIFLALSDTVLLLSQPFNKLWVIQLLGVDLRALTETSCKVFFVIFRSAKMTSSWLVVMLCFERFIAVVFPLKAKLILRKRFIMPAIAVNYIFMFIYNGVWAFSSGIVNGICKPDLPSLRHYVFVIVGCSIYSFVPTVLLLIFTPLIISRLIKQRKIREKLARAGSAIKSKKATGQWGASMVNANSKQDDDMLKASVMVLGVMIAYIVLIVPITTVHVYSFTVGVSAFDVNSYGFFIYREVAQMLEQINYAVNFFFYVLCSRAFRGRVKELLCFGECTDSGNENSLVRNSTKTSTISKTVSS